MWHNSPHTRWWVYGPHLIMPLCYVALQYLLLCSNWCYVVVFWIHNYETNWYVPLLTINGTKFSFPLFCQIYISMNVRIGGQAGYHNWHTCNNATRNAIFLWPVWFTRLRLQRSLVSALSHYQPHCSVSALSTVNFIISYFQELIATGTKPIWH